MQHKVYYGNFTLYGAEKVDVALARPVTVHNGLGFGEYPTPDDRKLREWTVKGQWTEKNDYRLAGWAPAHELIADLKSMMGSDDPERLVMTNGYDKTSVLAYVTDVNATETSAGVYDVTVKLTEYRKPVVRTTGVPAISRPGKIPEMPKTVVFKKSSDVGEDAVKEKLTDEENSTNGGKRGLKQVISYYWTDESGVMHQTNNPNIVPLEQKIQKIKTEVNPGLIQSSMINQLQYDPEYEKYWANQGVSNGKSLAEDVFDAMKGAIENFKKGGKNNQSPMLP